MNFLTTMVIGDYVNGDKFPAPFAYKPAKLFVNATKDCMTGTLDKKVPMGKKVLVGLAGTIIGLTLSPFMILENVVVAILVGIILLGLSVQAKISNQMPQFAYNSRVIGKALGQRVLANFMGTFFTGVLATHVK